jgi:hypothetical protein
MAKPNPISSLKESIRLLEIRQAEEGIILKEQFKETFESLKPFNLIKSSIKDLASSTEIKNNLFETVVSIITGYLTKKIMVNSKGGPLMKIVGAMLQYGVTSLVSKNAEKIRILFADLIERFFNPLEEEIPETEV